MMRIVLFTLLALSLAACGPALGFEQPAGMQQTANMIQASPTLAYSPTPAATSTLDITATPTIGYQATIDALNRQMVQSTADAEQRALEYARMTSTAESANLVLAAMTATQAGTSVPLTATQAEFNRRQTEIVPTRTAAAITATAYEPTAITAAANAETHAAWSGWLAFGEVVLEITGGLAILVISICMYLAIARQRFAPVPADQPEAQVIQIDDWGAGFGESMQIPLPGTPDQLRTLAQGIQEGLPLAFTHWIGSERPFSRAEFEALRYRLVEFGFAEYSDPTNRKSPIHLTHAGKQLIQKFSTN